MYQSEGVSKNTIYTALSGRILPGPAGKAFFHNTVKYTFITLLCVSLAGCGAKLAGSWNPLIAGEEKLPEKTDDIKYVLDRMEFARMAIGLGCYTQAELKLIEAFDQLDDKKSNTVAALTSEKYKYYKGETYERAAINWYLGYINYRKGDYNKARIYFSRALIEDRKAVVKKDTPDIIGDDFGVAYYWLGKVYHKLGESDNARIAFNKAAITTPRKEKERNREKENDVKLADKFARERIEGEKWTFGKFHNPGNPKQFVEGAVNLAEIKVSLDDPPAPLPFASAENPILVTAKTREEFFKSEFQAKANMVLTVELGDPPVKALGGLQGERTDLKPSFILPHTIRVFVDGAPAGNAFKVTEMWDQAVTQDRVGDKEGAQAAKAIAKTALSLVVNTSNWDVSGDIRRWSSLPGRAYVFAAKVKPGVHNVRFEMYDITGRLLPRWTNTYYGIRTSETGESTALLSAGFDADNAISKEKAAMALDAGALPTGRKEKK
ncbi:MAG: hypothetical protein ISS70_19125 [Phycisphaerae bacterium]|nr:hypothetical protein [Phycisphaerae bacterium]